MKNIILLFILMAVFACKKKDDSPDYASQVQGNYKGTLTNENNGEFSNDSNIVYTINKVNNNTVSITNGGISYTCGITYQSISGNTKYYLNPDGSQVGGSYTLTQNFGTATYPLIDTLKTLYLYLSGNGQTTSSTFTGTKQ